jgi:hypothetical protein
MDDADRLRDFLTNRNVPCPVCGYNLRELKSDRCPECGAALVIQVGSPQARIGLFLITVAPMFMLAAFGMFVGIAWLPTLLSQPPGALIMFIAAIADLFGVFKLYRHRDVFFRLTRGKQSVIAICSWVVHVAIFGVSLLLEV